jgi:hypothetical protein
MRQLLSSRLNGVGRTVDGQFGPLNAGTNLKTNGGYVRLSILIPLFATGMAVALSAQAQNHKPALHDSSAPQRLNAHFVADRVLVDAPLRNGGHIRFFTDTGGGGTILQRNFVTRIGWKTKPYTGDAADFHGPVSVLATALLTKKSSFPVPPAPVFVVDNTMGGIMPGITDFDGNIGQGWFADHIWT